MIECTIHNNTHHQKPVSTFRMAFLVASNLLARRTTQASTIAIIGTDDPQGMKSPLPRPNHICPCLTASQLRVGSGWWVCHASTSSEPASVCPACTCECLREKRSSANRGPRDGATRSLGQVQPGSTSNKLYGYVSSIRSTRVAWCRTWSLSKPNHPTRRIARYRRRAGAVVNP